MADEYKRPYVESSVFIAWVQGEVVQKKRTLLRTENVNGKAIQRQEQVTELVDRGKIVEHVFTLAEAKEFDLTTSAFTLAEVHKPKHRDRLPEESDERLLDYFEHEHIKLVDVDRRVGEGANRLCRRFGLDPADATHLACALRAGCDVLLTYDDKLLKTQHEAIRIEEPRILGQLTLLEPEEAVVEPLKPQAALSPGESSVAHLQVSHLPVAQPPQAAERRQSDGDEADPSAARADAEDP